MIATFLLRPAKFNLFKHKRFCRNGEMTRLFPGSYRFFLRRLLLAIVAGLGAMTTSAETASGAGERLQLQIKADQERYGAMFQRAEFEAMAQLIATNIANPQFSPAERKDYALGVELWLQAKFYATYLTLKRQQKQGEAFPVARLHNLFEQFDGVYQVLEELAPGELAVLKLQLNKAELYLVSY